MKSIRLSLVLYFLGLLTVVLGTASVLAYQTSYKTFLAKKEAAEELINSQYRESCRTEEQGLDEKLRMQAQALARIVNFQFDRKKIQNQQLHILGLLTSQVSPNGWLLAHAWIGQCGHNGLHWEIYRRNLPEIRFNDEDTEGQPAEYFQIDSPFGSYRSKKLEPRTFPLDEKNFAPNQVLYWEFDDVQLDRGLLVRRITLKTPAASYLPYGFIGRWPRPPRTPPTMPPMPPMPPEPRPRPEVPRPAPLYIHCASEMTSLRHAQAEAAQRRDNELAALAVETEESLASLRNRLLAISSLTFLATVVGSFWLVRLGLAPLRRLSDAVSQVSPRDFRLPFDEARLPAELKPIVQRLQETLDLLKRAFAREKQATADISHELRTPLAVLLTTTELALRKPRQAAEYREMLQDCHASAQQMNQIVERLLTLARLDAGVDHLHVQSIDAAKLAEECADLVRPLAEAQGLTLQVQRNGPMPLHADPDKLREVLTNLLHNAIQYNRPEGRIDLSVGRENGHLRLEVRDTGIGIAPAVRAHIFERFYRADPSRGGDGLHAGLGLALVKEYVDLMGGSIQVESVEGQGSTFCVQVPV
jgi:heavy metal sensor kinase